jgi:hypothetical protein
MVDFVLWGHGLYASFLELQEVCPDLMIGKFDNGVFAVLHKQVNVDLRVPANWTVHSFPGQNVTRQVASQVRGSECQWNLDDNLRVLRWVTARRKKCTVFCHSYDSFSINSFFFYLWIL